jgi:hypothetical protein
MLEHRTYGNFLSMEPIAETCGNVSAIWQLWWNHQLNPDCQLGLLSITWWGRIGKLLGAAGFMAVIIEIIGPDKLKVWGERLYEGSVQWQRDKLTDRAEFFRA